MSGQRFFSLCLALLLAFYCYPASCGSYAYADEFGGENDRTQQEEGSFASGDFSGVDSLSGNFDIVDSGIGFEVSSGGGDDFYWDGVSSLPVESSGPARVAPAVLLGYVAQALGVGASVTAILSGLNNLFGSPTGSSMTRTEALLSSILGYGVILSNDIGGNGTRLINIYNLLSQMYSNDFKGIYSLVSHIGVNTDLFKTSFSSLLSYLYYSGTLHGESSSGFSAGTIFAYTYNILYDVLYKNSSSFTSFLSNVPSRLYYSSSLHGESSAGFSVGTILAYTYNILYDVLYKNSSSFASFLSNVPSRLYYPFTLHGESSAGFSAAHILAYTYNLLYDYLPKLSSPDFSVSFDDSAVLGKLDDIKGLLLVAGAKDLVDGILGDFSQIVDSVQASALQSALESAFPFCIPLVIKQLLGLLEYDPSPPSFDFEVLGESMHVDMADAQGFVDVIGWAVRFLFVFGLLVSTPKFIYKEVAS